MRTARHRFVRSAASWLFAVFAVLAAWSVPACSTDGEVLTSLPPPEPIVPRAALDFTDSVGISIQPVRFAPSFELAVLPRLATLGIRHVRQWAVVPGVDAGADAEIAALQMLAAMGVRLHLIFEPRFGVEPEHVAALAQALGDALESVEGPNDNDANDVDL
ncbi:MAG TPA: hypothetical protein VK509_08625, partial [Polyangiales bacterium]|nr:hypothetical protein [Polyangiales bacterium]